MVDLDPVTLTAIVGAATGLVSLVMAAIMMRLDEKQVQTLQDLVKSLTSVVSSYDYEVASLRRDVEVFRTLLGPTGASVPARTEAVGQEAASEEREAAWARMREIAKALGWAQPGPRVEGGGR